VTGAKRIHSAERYEISQDSIAIYWPTASQVVDHKEASVSGADDRCRAEKRAEVFCCKAGVKTAGACDGRQHQEMEKFRNQLTMGIKMSLGHFDTHSLMLSRKIK
jgi:hypothetical protein